MTTNPIPPALDDNGQPLDGQFGKVTLLGPMPFGGTHTTTVDDPQIDDMLIAGHTVLRSWTVTYRDGFPVRTEHDHDSVR